MEPKSRYLSDFVERQQEFPGNRSEWVRAARAAALARFERLGFPGVRDEEWKYTNVGVIERHAYTPAPRAAAGIDVAALRPLLFDGLECDRLVFVDGHFAPTLSAVGKLPAGVTVGSLAAALEQDPDAVREFLGAQTRVDNNGFAALNAAFMSDGAYLYLPPGAVLGRPVHVIHVSTAAQDDVVTHVRNLLVAQADSQATVLETYAGLHDAAYLSNVQTEVVLGANAALEHYKLQQESDKARHVAATCIHQHRGSRYANYFISAGGRLVRNEIRPTLDGEGSECTLYGLCVLGGRQHVDNHTVVDHARPQTTSREYYKSVLEGHARSVFSGKVIVHPDAQHTDAQQTNHNLLLSDDAEADTRPQLEIYADDVKCAHGATVGQLDEEALYYLKARGIDDAAARNLLVYAFANDILNRLKIQPVRERLEQVLTTRLLHGRRIEDFL
ncbi:MAG: Fe-S cluster assembly protein SufD [Gammaproteobacteria bacterium]